MALSIFERVKETLWPGKRKVIGLPVYLEENGEVLGVVSDIVEAKDGKILSYVLENEVSTFQIPVENVLVTKRGLIFLPSWYANAEKFIKTLEIQEALLPEVFMLLGEENVPKEQIKAILDKASPETKRVLEEGLQLYDSINKKMAGFKKESAKIYSMISELTEKRVLGVIERREFASTILELKRKAQILEASMKRANEILKRLESSALLRIARDFEKLEKREEKVSEALPAHITPEQRAKIKKFRVLKVEKELKEMEEKLKATEAEIEKRVKEEVEKRIGERENMLRSEFIRTLESLERIATSLASKKLGKSEREIVDKLIGEIKRARAGLLPEKAKAGEGKAVEGEQRVCSLCGAVFEKSLDACPICGLKYEEEKPKKVVKKVEKK